MNIVTSMKLEVANEELVVSEFDCSLESLQEFVGGYVEAVRISDDIVLWINEEGKLQDLAVNFGFISLDPVGVVDVIVGNGIFTGVNEEGDIVALTQEQIYYIYGRFISRRMFKVG